LYEFGEADPCTYLVQTGRITLYSPRAVPDRSLGIGETENNLIRVRSLKRGAFMNEAVLYADDDSVPVCNHTAIADMDSILFSLNREDMKVLDAENPAISIQLHRKIGGHATWLFQFVDKREDTNDYYGNHATKNGTPNKSPTAGGHSTFRSATVVADDMDSDGTTLIKHPKSFKRMARKIGAQIANMPVINESLVVAGFREDENSKKSLLNVSSLNSGESSGRYIGRDLLIIDATDVPESNLSTLEDYKQRFSNVNEKIELDWFKVSQGATTAFPDDVARVLTVTRQEANEMVWEADVSGRGGITLPELIHALVIVEDREIQVENVIGADS